MTGNPSGSSLSGSTFTWTPSAGQAGSYTMIFTVSDDNGGTDSSSVTVTVAAPTPPTPSNQSPTLTAIADKTIEENQTLSFILSATDPDGDTLTYAVADNPAGSALTGNSFSWTPTPAQVGSYTPFFTVSDGKGGTNSKSVTITVVDPGTAQFSEPIAVPAGGGGLNIWGADWGDYDGDGDLDLVVSGHTGLTQTKFTDVFWNDGSGVLTPVGAGITPSNGQIQWGDFDNDGDLDLLQTGMPSGTKVYRNEAGTFVPLSVDLAGWYDMQIDWGDYDNDGDLDILIIGRLDHTSQMAKVYRNNGDATFTDIGAGLPPGIAQGGVAKWGDFDNDGDADILLSGVPSNETATWIHFTKIFRNDAGSFTDIGAGLPAITASGDWGDYDGDGDLDIILCGRDHAQAGEVFVADVYRNDGNESFVPVNAGLVGAQSSDVAWGDYDNDGDLDLLITSNNEPDTKLYRNDQGNFTKAYSFPVYSSHEIKWADFDNDGDLDASIGASGLAGLNVYRNLTSNGNTAPSAPTNLTSLVSEASVTLAWDRASDTETDQNSLSYNLCAGTTSGGTDVVAPMADVGSGTRKVTRIGNTYLNTSWVLKDLGPGTYYWRVQAIDGGYRGSTFSSEHTFTVTTPTPPDILSTGHNRSVIFPAEPVTIYAIGVPSRADIISVQAKIYKDPNTSPVAEIALIDNGLPPDVTAHDNIYSGQWEGSMILGNYSVDLSAEDGDGLQRYKFNADGFHIAHTIVSVPDRMLVSPEDLGNVRVPVLIEDNGEGYLTSLSFLSTQFKLHFWEYGLMPDGLTVTTAGTALEGQGGLFETFTNPYQDDEGNPKWNVDGALASTEPVYLSPDPGPAQEILAYVDLTLDPQQRSGLGIHVEDVLFDENREGVAYLCCSHLELGRGDVDTSGTIESFDAALVLMHAVQKLDLNSGDNSQNNWVEVEYGFTFPSYARAMADVSGQLGITALDASLILKHATDMITHFPTEEDYYRLWDPPTEWWNPPASYAPAKPVVTEPALMDRIISLGLVEAGAEGVLSVPVLIDELEGVLAGSFALTYDPAQLQPIGVRSAQLTQNYLFADHATDDRVRVAFAAAEWQQGSGVVAKVLFRYRDVDSKERGKLFLSEVQLNEGDVHTRIVSSGISSTATVPQLFALYPNYPNPVNPETTIRFSVSTTSPVNLSIYNLAGQRVTTLIDGVWPAGTYTTRWDGRDNTGRELASGVYLYRLQAGQQQVETRKLLLVR